MVLELTKPIPPPTREISKIMFGMGQVKKKGKGTIFQESINTEKRKKGYTSIMAMSMRGTLLMDSLMARGN